MYFFVKSAYESLAKYQDGMKTASTNIRALNSVDNGLAFPPLIFCNQKGFKSTNIHTSMEEFIRDTMEKEDFLIDVRAGANSGLSLLPVRYNVTTIFSAFYGRCYSIELEEKAVRPVSQFFEIITKPNVSLRLYVVDHAIKNLLAFDIWGALKPTVYEIKDEYSFADISLSKEIRRRDESCRASDESDRKGKSLLARTAIISDVAISHRRFLSKMERERVKLHNTLGSFFSQRIRCQLERVSSLHPRASPSAVLRGHSFFCHDGALVRHCHLQGARDSFPCQQWSEIDL